MKRMIILVLVSVLFSCNDVVQEPWTLSNSKKLAIEFCNDNKNRDFTWAKYTSFAAGREVWDSKSKLYYPLVLVVDNYIILDEGKSAGITSMPRYPYEEKELIESYNEYTSYFEHREFGGYLLLADSISDSLKFVSLQTLLKCEKPKLEGCYVSYLREYIDSCLSIEVSALILSRLPDAMKYKELNNGMEYLEFTLNSIDENYAYYFYDTIRVESLLTEYQLSDVTLLDEHWGYKINENLYDSITKELITNEE